jgi:glucose/arabinose dehydrogenase
MPRVRPMLLVGVTALVLAACGRFDGSSSPSWEPSPAFGAGGGPGAQASPIIPVPSGPAGGPGGTPGSGSAGPGGTGVAPSPSKTKRGDPRVVATHLTAPVGLTLLPDGTALVGERTTGRIVRVQPRAGQPVPTVRTLHGLDTSGDGGLLDLALSPTYAEDGLIYAYVTTRTDNRVVAFTLTGPVTPVLTGIPKGRTGNTGRVMFGDDGDLYVGTGDAGRPALAAQAQSLAGKVLRVDSIGDPAAGNPVATSPVWTRGHHQVNGLCTIRRSTSVFEVEAGATGAPDEVNVLSRGANYGWPASSAGARGPVATLPATYRSPGGCAVLAGRIWVTSLDGTALLSAPLRVVSSVLATGKFTPVLKGTYGRLKTVVAADDGALWLTTANRDGHGKPVSTDERVIRYVPGANSGGSPA